MTGDEIREYAELVKVLDLAVPLVAPPVWPLCVPAVAIVEFVEATTRYTCALCRSTITSHRCSCPVRSVRRGVRARAARGDATLQGAPS